MATSELISSLALVVSILSAAFTIYFNFRDRPKLVVKSKFHSGYEPGDERMTVTIVNAGRRPIILRTWAGEDNTGEWVGTFLGENHAGLRLGENEHYEFSLLRHELGAYTPNSEVMFFDLWVEDSHGKRHRVKDAKANIERLRGASEI